MFESNLYFFGIGVAVFLLMGLGLQLSADAVSPEFSPPVMRRSLAVGAVTVLAFFGIFAYREVVKSNVRYDRAAKASPDYGSLKSIADGDGEAHFLLGYDPALSNNARIAEFKEAAQLEPSVKHLRLLANAYSQTGNDGSADRAFRDALAIDPNNLETLARLMEFDRDAGHQQDAIETARRLVAVESKPYFEVRALPEIIPLQTADARVFLASQTANHREAADQLAAAANLHVQYARQTVPYLRNSWHDVQTDMMMAGETQAGVFGKLQHGVELAKSAATAYRSLGLGDKAAGATALATEIQSVLDDFTRALEASK
jgi:tetratricopeptide (TPR) repeat protein